VEVHLSGYDWPGNVRQLENTCRWLTVMAPGQDIHFADLPEELRAPPPAAGPAAAAREAAGGAAEGPAAVAAAPGEGPEWSSALQAWAQRRLASGQNDLLGEAGPLFERTLILVTLAACRGQRQEAAKRLGWGRNTLTRKIKDLGIDG
jgi:two-component system nitrogen regulation response regulator GlnG